MWTKERGQAIQETVMRGGKEVASRSTPWRLPVVVAIAIVLLVIGAFLTGAYLIPFLRTRSTVRRFVGGLAVYRYLGIQMTTQEDMNKEIQGLGGKDRAIARLAVYVRMPNWLAPEKHGAAYLLGWCGAGAVKALAEALNHPSQPVRLEAVRALARIGPEATVVTSALEKALTDEDKMVRAAAAEALQKIRGEPVEKTPE